MPPPVVSWNIAPSMNHAYSCREAELVPIPRYSLQVMETLGTCHAGEVILNCLQINVSIVNINNIILPDKSL